MLTEKTKSATPSRESGNARGRRRELRLLAVLLAGFLALACPPAAEEVVDDPDAVEPSIGDENALNSLVAEFMVAINEGDADAVAALYASDAVRMPPGALTVSGREAIRQNLSQTFEAADIEVQVQIEETKFSGELAYVQGTYALITTPRDGSGSTEVQGNWMRLMRREPDGAWLVASELWNIQS